MNLSDAIDLLHDAVPTGPAVWADLGAGAGTFTRALASILGAGSTIYAVDADASAVRALRELDTTSESHVVPVHADFTQPFDSVAARLDGILFANSLHFVRDQIDVLTRLTSVVRSGGRVVVVEYDRRDASQWVPYPIEASDWPRLATAAGLVEPAITARRPSMYAGSLYVGYAIKD